MDCLLSQAKLIGRAIWSTTTTTVQQGLSNEKSDCGGHDNDSLVTRNATAAGAATDRVLNDKPKVTPKIKEQEANVLPPTISRDGTTVHSKINGGCKRHSCTPPPDGRIVSFCETVRVIQNGAEPITEQERRIAWYQASEFQQFKVEIKATMQLLLAERQRPSNNDNDDDDGDDDDDDDDGDIDDEASHHSNDSTKDPNETSSIGCYQVCTWGLDRMFILSERQLERHSSIRAVLLEQELVRQQRDKKEQQQQQQQQQRSRNDTNDYDDDKEDVAACLARVYRYYTVDSAETAYWIGLKYAKEQPDRVVMNFCTMLAQENKLLRRPAAASASAVNRSNEILRMSNGGRYTLSTVSTTLPPSRRRVV
jgi:hypothetical protein